MNQFVNLHTQTYYSLSDSMITPKSLFERIKELNQPAIGVCEHGTMFSAWDCYKEYKKTNIKLLIGCEFNFIDDLELASSKQRLRHIILYAKNHEGYKNLLQLHRRANDFNLISGKKVYPRIDWNLLEQYSKNLVCLTSDANGILGQLINTRRIDEARNQAKRLKNIFENDLAFEIQPHAMKKQSTNYTDCIDQTLTNHTLIKFSKELNVKVVPTCDAHYLTPEQAETHDVLLAIGSGQPMRSNSRLRYTDHENRILPEFYLKTREQIVTFFSRLYGKSAEEWCDNTLEIADTCEMPDWIDLKFSNPLGKELPDFPVKNQKDYDDYLTWLDVHSEYDDLPEDGSYIRFKCFTKLDTLNIPQDLKQKYIDQINVELEVFDLKGINSYMEIVSDIINFCIESNIPKGPGRGSAGSSLVGYLLDIHKADPLRYNLVFERFYNKDKSAGDADIDMDFSTLYKKDIEKYICDKYGQNNVAAISNIITLKPKPYVRAIARVFQYGGGFKEAVQVGNALSDIIPNDVNTIDDLIKSSPLFNEYCKKYPELVKYKELSNFPVAFGKHAAGLVIGARPLAEIVPVRVDKDGYTVLEYEKERVAENGLLKIDILGLTTLDIIETCHNFIKKQGKTIPKFDYNETDDKTYDLISSGDTFTVFQFGTSGNTINLCKELKPKNMEDLALITTLARPGAADIRTSFIDTRFGRKKFDLLHKSLTNAFSTTLGFGLYDESILQIGQDVAGWSLQQSDRIRKMIKEKGKYPEKVAKLREEFIASTIAQGIDQQMAIKIWDEEIKKFGSYTFCKAHAILYSFTSFETAFLKTHFPVEFLTSNLIAEVNSNTKDRVENALKLKQELLSHGVKIIPPDINNSEKTFTIVDDKTLMTGFDAIKFVGKDAIPEIIEKRPFKSFEHFLTTVNAKKVKSPTIQALAACGALDSFGISRKQMFLYAADYKKKAQMWLSKNENLNDFIYPFPENIGEWTISEMNSQEIHYLGEGLTGSIPEIYPGFFDQNAINFEKLKKDFPDGSNKKDISAKYGVFEAVIEKSVNWKVRKETSKIFGQEMNRMLVKDPFGNMISCVMFPDGWEEIKKRVNKLSGGKIKLDKGVAIHFSGSLDFRNDEYCVLVRDIKKITGIPKRPTELKSKTVTMKITGTKKKKIANLPEVLLIMNELDDELAEIGLNEIEEEESFEWNDSETDIDEDEVA